jgi:hypothetical protein
VLADVDQQLKSKVKTPMSDKYQPEIYGTLELNNKCTTYVQGLNGVLRWIVAVAMLSSHLVAPREGHLEQTLHIFAYLDSHERSTLVFDSHERPQ